MLEQMQWVQNSSNLQAVFLIYTGGLNGAVPEIPEKLKTPGPQKKLFYWY